jgi:hypothetical protein
MMRYFLRLCAQVQTTSMLAIGRKNPERHAGRPGALHSCVRLQRQANMVDFGKANATNCCTKLQRNAKYAHSAWRPLATRVCATHAESGYDRVQIIGSWANWPSVEHAGCFCHVKQLGSAQSSSAAMRMLKAGAGLQADSAQIDVLHPTAPAKRPYSVLQSCNLMRSQTKQATPCRSACHMNIFSERGKAKRYAYLSLILCSALHSSSTCRSYSRAPESQH